MLTRMIAGQNDKISLSAPEEQELIDYIVSFKMDIALWGSPDVLLAQAAFESNSGSGSKSDNLLMFKSVDDLYRAFREDIGLSNNGLPPYHFVKALLSDPTELDEMQKIKG
ncbi:MAG: hypothetical protein L3J32_09780 [Rhizobiaceae bacterium]|nr:hypothetical protein [Rhizobiaceae bacterium]